MSKVLLDMSVSLDRVRAGPNGEDGGSTTCSSRLPAARPSPSR
jgi:hypothetical protein